MEDKVYLHFDENNKFWFKYDEPTNIIVDSEVVNIICAYTKKKNIRFVSKNYNGEPLYLEEKNFMDYFEEYIIQIEQIETKEQKRIRELEEELVELRKIITSVLDNKESL